MADDEWMTDDEIIAETIRRALAGDAEAGRQALDHCRWGLTRNNLHPDLQSYLAARITDVLDGIKPDRALRIAKPRGRPPDPLPKWQQELGAFAALLTQRGYRPQQIAVAMCDERRALHDKPLEESDAHAIRVAWEPMQRIAPDRLEDLAGRYGEKLPEYPLRKNR